MLPMIRDAHPHLNDRSTLCPAIVPIVIAGGSYATTTWHNPSIPAMMVIGGAVTLPAFVFFEINYATHPVMPIRLLRNRNVFAMCVINLYVRKCLDFLRGKLTGDYIQL